MDEYFEKLLISIYKIETSLLKVYNTKFSKLLDVEEIDNYLQNSTVSLLHTKNNINNKPVKQFKNLIIFVYHKAAYSGYNFKSKIIERFVKARGYKIIIIKHSQNIYSVIDRNIQDLAILYIHTSVYRLAGFDWFKYSKHNTFEKFLVYLHDLERQSIVVQPQIEMRRIFDTKLYVKLFENNLEFMLPGTKVMVFKDSCLENMIPDIAKEVNILLKSHDKVVVKKGFASVSRGNLYVTSITNVNEELQNFQIIKSTGYHTYDSDNFERDAMRVIIIQPYNETITNRENEYRMHFINNEYMGYICHGTDWNINPPLYYYTEPYDELNQTHIYMLSIAMKVKEFINRYISNPIIYRIDISYSTDQMCQDEHSVYIEEELRRYYVNEIELSPALYFDTDIDTRDKSSLIIDGFPESSKRIKDYQMIMLRKLTDTLASCK